MKCARQSSLSVWALLLLVFFMALVSLRVEGQETPNSLLSASDSESLQLATPTIEPTPTDPWQSFDQAWNSLKLELMGWSEDSQTLYDSLEALRIEAEGLRSSLTLSREQFAASEEARMIERKAAEAKVVDAILRSIEAQNQMEQSRTATLVVGGVGLVGWILAAVALVF
jgi:hypothetical protein